MSLLVFLMIMLICIMLYVLVEVMVGDLEVVILCVWYGYVVLWMWVVCE